MSLFSPCRKYSLGHRGVSLVEAMVASTIVATTVVGATGMSSYLAKQSRRSQRVFAVIGLQSLLQSELINRENYQATSDATRNSQLDAMKAGRPTKDFEGFTLRSPNGHAIARVNQRTYHRLGNIYDQNGECAGPDHECQVFVDLDLNCTDIVKKGCIVAYRIGLAEEPGEVNPAPLGAPERAIGAAGLVNADLRFTDDDYAMVLGSDLFTLKTISDPETSCNAAADEITITGVNRVTGTVTCLKKPLNPCPDQTVAHTVRAYNDRLEFACHALASASCPANYVFQKIDLAQFDHGVPDQQSTSSVPLPLTTPLRGTCVYRWRTHIPWQRPFPVKSGSASFTTSKQVCNGSVYNAAEAQPCQIEVTNSKPGCCPDNDGGCSSTPASTVTARSFTDGGSVSCVVTIVDACGSSATARAAYPVGTCEIKVPQHLPPVGGSL